MRMKNFYAVLHKAAFSTDEYYCIIEAPNLIDAMTYADHHFEDRLKKVYASGGFWEYKKNHPKIQPLPKELA